MSVLENNFSYRLVESMSSEKMTKITQASVVAKVNAYVYAKTHMVDMALF
jgi:hypothetical protein